jgi:hypothetical protein
MIRGPPPADPPADHRTFSDGAWTRVGLALRASKRSLSFLLDNTFKAAPPSAELYGVRILHQPICPY